MRFLTIVFMLIAFLPAQAETSSDKIRDNIVHRICSGLKRVDFDKDGVDKAKIMHQRMKKKGILPGKKDKETLAFLKQLLDKSLEDVKVHKALYLKVIGFKFDSKLCSKKHIKKK